MKQFVKDFWHIGLIYLALLVVALSPLAHSQTAILLPDPHPQFFDVNGNPLAGGRIFTFLAGTAINQVTYTDSTASVANSNPIILNSAGFPTCSGSSCGIYLTNGVSYRIVVQNSLGVQQWVADNVKLVNSAQVGGANTQVQYNCAGAFCGSPNFTFNAGSQTLTVTALVVNAGGTLNGTFSGNPTFSGTVTFSGSVNFGAISANSITATGCSPTAAAGTLRLCNVSTINWRNFGNTADLAIGVDTSDRFVVNATNGLILSATSPNILLGGATASFPMFKRSGTTAQVRLADDTGFAPLAASTIAYDATGVVISGTCSTGQVETATSSTAVSCQTPPAGVQTFSSTTCTLCPVTFGNSSTTIITKTLTMPSTGCPCRVHASYNLYLTTGNSGTDVSMVTDGTVNFAAGNSETTGAVNGGASYGVGGSGFSPTTYANGATPTFTIKAASSHAGSTTAQAAPGTDITPAWDASTLDLTVFTSN